MPRLRLVPKSAWLALLIVLLIGGGIRADQAINHVPPQELSSDAQSYMTISQHLATTGNYSGLNGFVKALHWPPATAHVFRIAYEIAPGDRPAYRNDVNPLHWAQFGISTLTIVVVFLLGWILGGPWAGVATAALVAFYPPLAWAPSNLLSEPLGALMLSSALTAVALAWRTGIRWWWATAGSLFGGVLLTRTDLLFVPPVLAVLALVVLGNTVGWRKGVESAALLVVMCVIVVLPWTIYASGKAEKFVPITTGGGSAFFVGTFLDGNGSTFDMKYVLQDEIRAKHPEYADTDYKQIPAELVLNEVAARHPDLDRDEALLKEARENLRDAVLGRPNELAGLMVFKLGKMWLRATLGGSSTKKPVLRTGHVVLVLVTFLGLMVGVVGYR
ncbi:MAG: hypothetical protein AB7G37_17405, partial [Solirubrobacteraceae bacterium]